MLDDARLYLVHFLKGKQNAFERKHPWRKDWKFAVLHSLHVESYVLRILDRQPPPVSETEIKLLRLAAILHDLARLEGKDNHAKLGAEIAEQWLGLHPEYLLSRTEIQRVSEMIADHSNKDSSEPDFCKAVLKDADILDEIGAMSIFMTSNWLETESPFFFHELRQRLIDFELPFCEKQLARLNTEAAKEILHEKKGFIENFIVQITDELQADRSIEQILFARSTNGD
jgi:HD superfamily phosphodiesterase